MPDPDLKFRLQVKSNIEILAELHVKAGEILATATPPMSVADYCNQCLRDLIARQHKPVATWPRKTEKRDGPPAAKPETKKPN